MDVLGVTKSTQREKNMVEVLNDRVLTHTNAGIEEIIGVHGYGFWMNIFDLFNRKYLRRFLEREPDLALDEELVYTESWVSFKDAFIRASIVHKYSRESR